MPFIIKSLAQAMMKQAGSPSGYIGRLMGRMMNRFHHSTYLLAEKEASKLEDATVLDIGCGGGRMLNMMASCPQVERAYGIDHSSDMVELSRRNNRSLIDSGKVSIAEGESDALEFQDEYFDMVTAFETVIFWPDWEKSFLEIERTLKPGGILLLVNRRPEASKKDNVWASAINIRSLDELKTSLEKSGFEDVLTDNEACPGWLYVKATKAL